MSSISLTVSGRDMTSSFQRFGTSDAEAQIYCTSTMGLAILLRTLFLASFVIQPLMAMERPMPAASWMNSFAPVLWNSTMYSLSCLNIWSFWYSHLRPGMPSGSRMHCMPGRIRPTPSCARLSRK